MGDLLLLKHIGNDPFLAMSPFGTAKRRTYTHITCTSVIISLRSHCRNPNQISKTRPSNSLILSRPPQVSPASCINSLISFGQHIPILRHLGTSSVFTIGLSLALGPPQPFITNLNHRRAWSGIGEKLGAFFIE